MNICFLFSRGIPKRRKGNRKKHQTRSGEEVQYPEESRSERRAGKKANLADNLGETTLTTRDDFNKQLYFF